MIYSLLVYTSHNVNQNSFGSLMLSRYDFSFCERAHTLTVAAGTDNLATGQRQLDGLRLVLSAGDTTQPSSLMHTETDAHQRSPRSSLHALFDGPRLRPSDVALFQSVSCSLGVHRLSDIK